MLDVFRDWDEDESGNISRDEFRKAMALLGVSAVKEVVDGCFDSFDADGSGTIEYNELDKLLRATSKRDVRHAPARTVAHPRHRPA